MQDGLRLTGWETGYPRHVRAARSLDVPLAAVARRAPGMVVCDLVDHHGELDPHRAAHRAARAVDRLAALGYAAEVGVEIEFYLLDADGRLLADGVQCYSLQKANELDPAFGGILRACAASSTRGGNIEYGPAQCEVNLRHAEPDGGRRPGRALQVRDQGARAPRGRDRDVHGQAVQRHLGQLDAPARLAVEATASPPSRPTGGEENALHRAAIGGIMRHLPGIDAVRRRRP